MAGWVTILGSISFLQPSEKLPSLLKKRGNTVHNRDGYSLIVSVTCLTAHLSVNPPHRPVAKQQTLLISRSDQIGKRHPIELIWRGGDRLKMALQHLVADFVGELEPLNQAITNLRIRDVALITDQSLVQAIDRI